MESFSAIEAECNRSWIDTVMSSFLYQFLLHPASIALKNSIEILFAVTGSPHVLNAIVAEAPLGQDRQVTLRKITI